MTPCQRRAHLLGFVAALYSHAGRAHNVEGALVELSTHLALHDGTGGIEARS